MNLLQNIRYIKYYREYKRRLSGKNIADFDLGCGFYLPSSRDRAIGFKKDINFKSGRKALCECVAVEFYRDPYDMVKHGYFRIIKFYDDDKPLSEMGFEEYIKSLYGININN